MYRVLVVKKMYIFITIIHIIFMLMLLAAGQSTAKPEGKVKRYGTNINKNEEPRYKLLHTLLQDYNPGVRPVLNHTDIVTVNFGIALNQIVELVEQSQFLVSNVWIQIDEKNQILRQQAWVRLNWTDEFMTWDPDEYEGVDTIYVNVEDLWRPDIVLYNSVDQERTSFEVFPPGLAIVLNNGTVKWLMPVIMQSLCRIKVENYPFDVQDCPLKFGSWSLDGSKLDIKSLNEDIDLEKYVKSVEWELLDVPCKRNQLYYACCDHPFPDVTCSIRMRRRPAFYLFNLVFPTILLIIIGLFVFCLPPDSGEKVSLAITVLLAMTVFMLIVMENVPPNSEAIPMLEQFIGGTIALLTLSTAMAVFVVNFHFRGVLKTRPHPWIRFIVLKQLAKVVRLRKCTKQLEEGDGDSDAESHGNKNKTSYTVKNGGISLVSISARLKDRQPPPFNSLGNGMTKMVESSGDSNGNGNTTNALLGDILEEMREQNRVTMQELNDKKQEEHISQEWIMVAVVIDRIFFWLLFFVALFMTIGLFWKQIVDPES